MTLIGLGRIRETIKGVAEKWEKPQKSKRAEKLRVRERDLGGRIQSFKG